MARALEALLGPPPEVPARIRAAVAAYEAESERIIVRFQLAGVILFGVLYAASYAAFDVHHGIEPAPVAIALYGAVTLWRLSLPASARTSKRHQYASAAFDVVLLIALIWSFPFQYDEPSALYLKAPTLLYAFILIALRGLRFDPGQVFFTGVAAACGWLVLALYALADGAPVTGDYRVYMQSLSFLPGAELEKIAAIVVFSAVLALSVARARSLLFKTASDETAVSDLTKFVGRDTAAIIRGSEFGIRAGDGMLRQAAVMFIDLRGFTTATRGMKPSDIISLLRDYQSRLLPIIERFDGSIDKFLGDGILASFGAVRPSDRECGNALSAAQEIIAEIDRWRDERSARGLEPFDVGVAIAFGTVIFGAVGDGDRLEFTVIGEPVNLAAKLEKHAKRVRARLIVEAGVSQRAVKQGFAAAPPRLLPGEFVDGTAAPVDLAVYSDAARMDAMP